MFFLNIGAEPFTFDLAIEPDTVGLSSGEPYVVYEIRNGTLALLSSSAYLPQTFGIVIDPLDMLFVIVDTELRAVYLPFVSQDVARIHREPVILHR